MSEPNKDSESVRKEVKTKKENIFNSEQVKDFHECDKQTNTESEKLTTQQNLKEASSQDIKSEPETKVFPKVGQGPTISEPETQTFPKVEQGHTITEAIFDTDQTQGKVGISPPGTCSFTENRGSESIPEKVVEISKETEPRDDERSPSSYCVDDTNNSGNSASARDNGSQSVTQYLTQCVSKVTQELIELHKKYPKYYTAIFIMWSTAIAILSCVLTLTVVYQCPPKCSLTNETDITPFVKQVIEQQLTLQGLNQTFNSTVMYVEMMELTEMEKRLRQEFEAKLMEKDLQFNMQMKAKVEEIKGNSTLEIEALKTNNVKMNEMHEKSNKELREEMTRNITAIQQESKKELESTVQNLTVEYNNKIKCLNESWEAKLKTEAENSSNTLKTMQDTFLEKFKEVNYRQDLAHTVIDHMGFMKKETWGLVIVFMGLVEIVLVVLVCSGFCRDRARGDNPDIAPGNDNQARAPPLRIALEANTMSVVCFRNDERHRLERLGRELIRGVERELPNLRVQSCVVNNRNDIQNIPACKVALIFVYPDEREMILEDPRQHIGGTLRKDVVETLMDSRVKTILIIYDDRNSTADQLQQALFNPRLNQIEVHELLRRLKGDRLILSIHEHFSDHQKIHLENKLREYFN